MAKGSIAKEEVTKKILETFNDSFKYEKEIRIPVVENGENLQIKCVLTCAKENVEQGSDSNEINFGDNITTTTSIEKKVEITQEEKDNINKLAEMLGF